MIQGPQRASLEDFDSILELANECFTQDRDREGMLARWPHCYIRDADFIKNCIIMKDDAKVVSLVEYVDQTVMVKDAEIKVAGITAVSTWPTYRNRGFMTELLKRCILLMEEEGYAFSDLGGDRQRYGRFGWENGGRAWRFDISKRSLNTVRHPEGFEVMPYKASGEQIAAIMAIHEQEPLRMKRSRSLYEILLGRAGKQVWLAGNPEGILAYVITEQEEGQQIIMEFGGKAECIQSILAYFMDALGSQYIHIRSPWTHPINKLLFSISSGWNLGTIRMIKIMDIEKTMQGFAYQIGEKYRALEIGKQQSINLGISCTNQQVEIQLGPEGANVQESSSSRDMLELSERDTVRFIFGPGIPSTVIELPENLKFLDFLFPVDFYLWPNETV